MLNSHYVITLGLTPSQNTMISDYLRDKECEVLEADNYLDLITSDYFIAIINKQALNKEAIENLSKFYTEIDGKLTESIIICPDPDDFCKLMNAQLFKSFEDFEKKLDDIFQKALRRAKKKEKTIKNFSDAIIILSQIKINPGISTKELAEAINRSPRVVKRYIEVLCLIGESIEYDMKAKGWNLQNDNSLLMYD